MQCPPTPGPGLRILTRGWRVGQCDGFPDIHLELVGQAREFIGSRDINIAVSVFHEFDHLGRGGIRHDDVAGHESAVEVFAGLARKRV